MKKLLLLTLIVPSFLMAMHHKSEPIIFYLDMDIAEGKSEGVEEFVDYLVSAVKKTEPKTMYYKYWISEDKSKVSLMEVYHTNEDVVMTSKRELWALPGKGFDGSYIVLSQRLLYSLQ